MNAPFPLVSAEVDLRGMAFMPLDVVRLLDSDLFALATGNEFKAALALWCKAWLQVPAASLPSDDRVLAHLSGTGATWSKVKAMALRGWELCADGRYYHPVIAEKALEAWKGRLRYKEKHDNESERQRRHRKDQKELRDQLRAFGTSAAWDTPIAELQKMLDTKLGESELPTSVTRTGSLPHIHPQRLREKEEERQGQLLHQEHGLQHDSEDTAPAEDPAGTADPYDSPAPLAPTQHSSLPTSPTHLGTAKCDPLAGFASFYEFYPRHQKRDEAEKAWRKLNPDLELQRALMAALARHRLQDAWLRNNGQFIPLPASWLNARRWEDELEIESLSLCPAQSIVDLYHQCCPTFDVVTVLDTALRTLLEERWREHEAQQDLGFWQEFFSAASGLSSIYFCGAAGKPYLEALLSRKNFRDIVEGRAHA